MSVCVFMLVFVAGSLLPGESRHVIDKPPTLDVCTECRRVVQRSDNVTSSSDPKENLYESLRLLCQRLPGEASSDCESRVKTFWPHLLQQTSVHPKPAETCLLLGLCAGLKDEQLLTLPLHATGGVASGSTHSAATGSHELFNPTCTLCLIIIKKLESLLPTNMTEDALMKLMAEVCDLVPQSHREQCDDFVAKYGRQVVEFLLSSAAPHTICVLLHVCLFQEQTLPGHAVTITEAPLPSDCESCRTLDLLSRLHLPPNSTDIETSSFLRSVCVHHPKAIPKCEAFITIYGDRLRTTLGNQLDGEHACGRADLCTASRRSEPLGHNRCTLGPSYWCKNVQTAQKCGNQAFCERYMWKD